jgi:hypothetical protein
MGSSWGFHKRDKLAEEAIYSQFLVPLFASKFMDREIWVGQKFTCKTELACVP